MDTIAQVSEHIQTLLQERARELGRETGCIKRERELDGSSFALSLIGGWLQNGDQSVEELANLFSRLDLSISASGLTQRFTEEAATLFERLLQEAVQMRLQSEAVPVALLKRFREVIVEDSSVIMLPAELAAIWKGNGGLPGTSEASVKLFVRWDLLRGSIEGPVLTDGKHSDKRSPLPIEGLQVGGLYVADLGFFALDRLAEIIGSQRRERRYVLTRWFPGTGLYTRSGHRLSLEGLLPRQVGQTREMMVLVGRKERLPMRLILQRVPPEVAAQRREGLRIRAQDHGREPSEKILALAEWSIVLTNVPARLANVPDLFVLLRARWQIERLFRLWKEHGKIDEWRSKKRWRILCELYAKLIAMLIQHWIIQASCWDDPERSLVKAAQIIRREAAALMAGLIEGRFLPALRRLVKQIRRGCHLNRRKKRPSTAQLLLGEELEWALT